MKFLKVVGHLTLFLFLTAITQIGGFVYLFTIIIVRKKEKYKALYSFLFFAVVYFLVTVFIVPEVAKMFGRQQITKSESVNSTNLFIDLANRNYVHKDLNASLQEAAEKLSANYPEIKIKYLDANFPFFDGFPLLPHLSHKDGKKLDLAFIYEKDGKIVNTKPASSGYGVFVAAPEGQNQTETCKSQGYWQYDYTKYLTFGTKKGLILSDEATQFMIRTFVKDERIGKLLIEPHLKKRLNLKSDKVRFQGCHAVRHDDHLHIQLK